MFQNENIYKQVCFRRHVCHFLPLIIKKSLKHLLVSRGGKLSSQHGSLLKSQRLICLIKLTVKGPLEEIFPTLHHIFNGRQSRLKLSF